jgi:signal transduction histidine kinase
MPDWHMSLYLDDPALFATAASRQNAVYLWTGTAGVLAIVAFSMAIAAYLGRQIRLTRLKNDLIATVSHELKTPLASMRVLVDTLREGRYKDAQQVGKYFELIAKENERLSHLIDNFLTFSRMERNKQAFEFVPLDINEVAQAAADAVRDRFAPPQSQLDVDLAEGLPKVRADHDGMVTAILNLVDNAWKYSGDHKLVKIRTYATGFRVFVQVSDNGVGMSRRAAGRIFDKFYQVDQTLSRRAGGCGLGLSIVKFIIDAHGGTIHVQSQPGKGSTFTLQLQAADARVSP